MILGTGPSSLDLAVQYSVGRAFDQLTRVSTRLATGLRVGRGSDGPAALIAADHLARDLAAWQAGAEALERTSSVVHVADTALAHAGSLLLDVQANLVAAADGSLNEDQLQAVQYEIDGALDALGRLGDTTWAGKKLFGESLSFLAGAEPYATETLEFPALDDSLGGPSGRLAQLRSGGSAAVSSNPELAAQIAAEAQAEVLDARAQAGAFERYVVDSTQRVMQDTSVHLAAARSQIQDADMAAEATQLVREMILADSSVLVARLTIRARESVLPLLQDLLPRRSWS